MPKLETKPLPFLKINPTNPRKDFPEADLRSLGESLRKKQLQPILAQPDGTIIAGERRYRAAKLVGLATLEVKIADETLTDSEIRIWQLVENLQRADLTGWEKYVGVADLLSINVGWELKEAADALSIDPSSITRIMSPGRCSAAWQEALKDGKVGISDCYAASKCSDGQQASMLAAKLNGATRDQLEASGRRSRNGHADHVRQARVIVPLATGMRITVTGEAISLQDLIDALTSALDAAKRANKDALDVKTAQRVWADKCKAAA